MRAMPGVDLTLPSYALRVITALETAGFESWAVGGWVRDALLGRAGHDVDITTSATWRQSAEVLRAAGICVHETGITHGTVTALCEGKPVEVTTYRVEGSYSDLRHPDKVRFVRDVRDDLARRDFTINAIAYHPLRGLLDPYGGQDDLKKGVIRAVGDPSQRFGEDALRVLRAVRFACRLGFRVDPPTQKALISCAPELDAIASERIGQEMDGIVRTGRADWALLHETDVMQAAIPELGALRGFDQRSPYHAYDALEHTARVCRGCEEFEGGVVSPELRWAALLHDIAKPQTFSIDETGRGHFFGHPRVGATVAQKIMRRLSLPNDLIRPVCMLVRMHDHVVVATPRSVRRTLRKFELACPGRAISLSYQLLDLKRADAVSKVASAAGYAVELDKVSAALRREVAAGAPVSIRDLAVDGADVMREMKIDQGPAIGLVLDTLLAAVINDGVPNDRNVLLSYLRARA